MEPFDQNRDCQFGIFLMFIFSNLLKKTPQKKIHFEADSDANSSEWVLEFVKNNDWLCTVEESYINDNFNLYGLSTNINDYSNAIKIVRGNFVDLTVEQEKVEKNAEILYGLIHQRYLMTFAGIKAMEKRYESGLYGHCPRVGCCHQNLLPVGLSPHPGVDTVKTFCPSCQDVYDTDYQLDGACFGPYFPHFFVQALRGDLKLNKPQPTKLTYMDIPIDDDSNMNRCKYVHKF